jgi:hypothetical protein
MPKSRMKKFNINLGIYNPVFENIQLVYDQDWNVSLLEQKNIPASESIRLKLADSTKLFDENGKETTTLQHLLNSLVPNEMKELPPTEFAHNFDKPTFIETQDDRIPKIKIISVRVTISKKLVEIEMNAQR